MYSQDGMLQFFLDLNIIMLSPEDAVNNFGSKNPHLAYYSTLYHNFLSCLALKHGTITTFTDCQ